MNFSIRESRVVVRLDASRERVWRALTEDIASWWLPEFSVGGEEARMVLEARVGGNMREDWGEGQGLVWAQVAGCRRPEFLLLTGALTREFGGPARTHLEFRLEQEEEGGGTVLTLTETAFGAVDPADRSTEEGWEQRRAGALKPWVEDGGRN